MFSSVIVINIFSSFLKPGIPQWNLCSAQSRLVQRHSQHVLAHFIKFFIQYLMQFHWSIFLNSKQSKSTPKYDERFHLSKTNWQSKMADIVNIYNRHVYQYNIRNSGNLKIMFIFWSHFVLRIYRVRHPTFFFQLVIFVNDKT